MRAKSAKLLQVSRVCLKARRPGPYSHTAQSQSITIHKTLYDDSSCHVTRPAAAVPRDSGRGHVTVTATIICLVSIFRYGSMPFPKLLTKVKLWIGVLFLLLLTMFYFYLRFNKVRVVVSDSQGSARVAIYLSISFFLPPLSLRRKKRVQLVFLFFVGSPFTTSHHLITAETLSKATPLSQTNWVSLHTSTMYCTLTF